MKVEAKATGFYGGLIREPGDVFEIKDGERLGSWMVPADVKASAGRRRRGPEPAVPESGPETDTGDVL